MLEEERKRLDEIDGQIVELVVKRLKIAEEIAKVKNDNGLSICDTKREEEVLSRLKALVPEEFSGYIATVYRDIFYISKEHQREYIKNVL